MSFGGVECRADNSGLVETGCGNEWCPGFDAIDELLQFGCAAAAQNEEVGGEEKLEASQIFVEAFAPAPPGEILAFAHCVGAVVLGDHPFQHQVAQLGVGQQVTVDEDCGADTGADRDEDDNPLAILAGTKAHLGQTGGVGIVEHIAGLAGDICKQVLGIGLNPALVDVGRALGNAVVDGGRKAATHRSFPVEVFHQSLEGMGNGGRGRRLWCGNAMALANQLTGFGIDQTALDPRASNIHSQHLHL